MRVGEKVMQVVQRRVSRLLVTAGVSAALAIGVGATAHASPRIIAYEFGCVNWNDSQGCMEYTACAVYDTSEYDCNSYVRGRDF